ncbi:N-acetylmuramoyl-L-alanine amidase [Chamaesiphon minutus]|uniref:N-acetylmuramoyl-L-alanine amidase n=1 Tax=Chamaesiphon minutus (strain ATCC 27169 / PCC 6605) TaxID=1173020 RepID=K9UQJ4_CHAP6|nr:N-acetylmuramoyl-L-alanine amidase [Chamaesiphon minutus]AFY96509.1 N-acetylmuramoyl-L-alanine amidase [Chamaesiphon minutus PCC 6605]
MKQFFRALLLGCLAVLTAIAVHAEAPSFQVVYPPNNHTTKSDRIFFIGTAPAAGVVTVNSNTIRRSRAGHFAPSFPLQVGDNLFSIRYQDQERKIKVSRVANQPTLPSGLGFAANSLQPALDIARPSGEPICFSAVAAPNATVSVKLANQNIPLTAQPPSAQLPASNAILTGQNQPINPSNISNYQGCNTISATDRDLNLGKPEFQLALNGQTTTQVGGGQITILSPIQFQVATVTAPAGVARTGPSTDYSRLTPLPQGTRSVITGREGDWLRLGYGGWIDRKETQILPSGTVPPRAIIRSVGYRQQPQHLEMVFPLTTPVPVTVQPNGRSLVLTLHNTTAQTDVIRLDDNPLISRLDWQQVAPDRVQYTFNFKKDQHWGYQLRYEGSSLVMALRRPPVLAKKSRQPLTGIKVLIDPGHGGKESGAPGPNGYLEKDVNLIVSRLVRDELRQQGATVVMTREDDRDLSLPARMAAIERESPTLALSIHYNSLPDNGDLEKTKGVGTFWYHPSAHSLAIFMQNYIVKQMNRPSYGVFWNNLALTRPTAAPSVLLELGFMTNPEEFEWVTNPQQQRRLAQTIAQGVREWLQSVQ